MMVSFSPAMKNVDLLVLLDGLRVRLLGYADDLNLTDNELQDVQIDYVLMSCAVRTPHTLYNVPQTRRAVMKRTAALLSRVQSHPAFTDSMGRDLGVPLPATSNNFALSPFYTPAT